MMVPPLNISGLANSRKAVVVTCEAPLITPRRRRRQWKRGRGRGRGRRWKGRRRRRKTELD